MLAAPPGLQIPPGETSAGCHSRSSGQIDESRPRLAGMVRDSFAPLGQHDIRPYGGSGELPAEMAALAVRETSVREGLAIYIVVNGPLGMSAGKIAAQAFQAAQRLFDHAAGPQGEDELVTRLGRWRAEGTCTITRIAETTGVFERLCREVPGIGMIDEGLTEVAPGSLTIWASWPFARSERPRMLRHRRIPLLRAPA